MSLAVDRYWQRREADWVNALTLHKERIRLLQEALCECGHPEFFQPELHDEMCPVYRVSNSQPESE